MSLNNEGINVSIDSVETSSHNLKDHDGQREVIVKEDLANTQNGQLILRKRINKSSTGETIHDITEIRVLTILNNNNNKHAPKLIEFENGGIEQEFIYGIRMENIKYKEVGLYTTAKVFQLYFEAMSSFVKENIDILDPHLQNFIIETDDSGLPKNAVCIDFGHAFVKEVNPFRLNQQYNVYFDQLTTAIIKKETNNFASDIETFFGATAEDSELLADIISNHTEPMDVKIERLKKLAAKGQIKPIEDKTPQDTILISEEDMNEKIIPKLKN